jgi:hypothetical protein
LYLQNTYIRFNRRIQWEKIDNDSDINKLRKIVFLFAEAVLFTMSKKFIEMYNQLNMSININKIQYKQVIYNMKYLGIPKKT